MGAPHLPKLAKSSKMRATAPTASSAVKAWALAHARAIRTPAIESGNLE